MGIFEQNKQQANVDDGTTIASWERPRSIDELRSFVARREAIIADLGDE